MKYTNEPDRLATQEFALRNVLVDYCGRSLTPASLDRMLAQLIGEIREGPTAWAFRPNPEAIAKIIYDQWQHMPGWVPWVEGGNSNMQDKARELAQKV